MIYIYSQTFDFQRFGYGVALSWLFFILVLVLTVIIITTSRYWVYYEVAQEGGGRCARRKQPAFMPGTEHSNPCDSTSGRV
jgi:uncharacterized protein YqgC (DUF456 family)